MQWHERLQAAIRDRGWTPAELARQSGVPRDSVYKYVRGEVAAPRGDTLDRLAEALQISTSWLLVGVEVGEEDDGARKLGLSRVPLIEIARFSMLTKGQDPTILHDADGETVAVPNGVGARSFAVRIEDDSMTGGPGQFKKGDVVVFDPDAPVQPGRYVLARVTSPSGVLFRRIRGVDPSDPTRGDLVAENTDFPTVALRDDSAGWIIARAVKRIQDI